MSIFKYQYFSGKLSYKLLIVCVILIIVSSACYSTKTIPANELKENSRNKMVIRLDKVDGEVVRIDPPSGFTSDDNDLIFYIAFDSIYSLHKEDVKSVRVLDLEEFPTAVNVVSPVAGTAFVTLIISGILGLAALILLLLTGW